MNLRALVICCAAVCLLVAGLPALSASPDVADATQPMPCEGQDLGHELHHSDCAESCQTSPELPGAEPDWGPAGSRASGPDLPDSLDPAPGWRRTEPARNDAVALAGPRDPPAMPDDSPVVRSDRLLD